MAEIEKKLQKVLEIATNRFMIIAPALAPDLNPTEHRQVIQEIVEKNGISERTVYRLLEKYSKGQLEALKPRVKAENEIVCTAIKPDVLEYALKLKIELPKRSVPQILATMKSQGIIKGKEVAQSTLRRYIRRMKHMWNLPTNLRGTGSRSFQMSKCNIMWQSDIKEVREIKIFDENNPDKKTFVYWVAFLDDKSRLL